ncbi:MAG: phosphate ABC transporter ATP-binding protein PstB [Mycoplasmoidaceae bacterium]
MKKQKQTRLHKKLVAEKRNVELLKVKPDFNKNKNAFEVRNWNLWYGDIHSLIDVNVNVEKNKVTSLIGPNGAGKTVFLRCLNRMNNEMFNDVKTTGNIYFYDGTNLYSPEIPQVELTTRVGTIQQKPTPFPMSIYDNVAYGPRLHGITDKNVLDKIVHDSLDDAALWSEVKDHLSDFATSLSGGQQQRLCIARAIALKPEVLLMDQPTAALDPIAATKIENLILSLKKRYTIVLVTHSMSQAQRVSDNTFFFYKGRIIEAGPTRQVFSDPKQKLTKDYILGR